MNSRTPVTLESVLDFVKESRGFDFTGYKRSTIERRVLKRMKDVGIERYEDYLDYLQVHGEEFAELFNALLINVTGFFRDLLTWEYMAEEVAPQLVDARPPNSPIRVWCAGCASGEEAYTIAMVLARVLGEDAFCERVKIYATDIDEQALDTARHAAYLPRQIEDIPADALERFFERTDQRYVFRNDLRRCVIFGRNDLVQDAPISHIDLLVCRNTLMYFTVETQAQILRRFHFALDDDGVLLLGKSEMLIIHSSLFTPVDVKRRLFRKVLRPGLRERVRTLTVDPANGVSPNPAADLREAAFEAGRSAHIVLDANGSLMMANAAARNLFSLRVTDFGRPIQDLELSYRPVELRSLLDTMASDMRGVELKAIRWRLGDHERVLDVRLSPLLGDGVLLGTSVAYDDVTDSDGLRKQLNDSKRELEQAYEELQSTVEELETTNEELQSTNEELETTNEELQSTNEELETMNEELHSSNEELETMNEELRHRSRELNDVNSFLETIFATMGIGVAVVDRQSRVQIWNGNARELWGLAPDEVEGEHLLALDIGLPLGELRGELRAALSGQTDRIERVLDAVNRRGHPVQCRVTIVPIAVSGGDGANGAVVMMEPLGA
jgi:two-component system CheB/CheR fusion protein